MEPAAPPPNASRRWPRRLAGAGAVGLVVVLVVHFIVLPWIVRVNVAKAFDTLGMPGATFEVRRATPWGSTIGNIVAADGNVRVESIEAAYNTLRILSGRIDRITIRGAAVRAAIRDGKPVLPVQMSSGGSGSGELPFRVLELASSAAVIELDGQSVRVPIEGKLENSSTGELAATAKIGVEPPASGDMTLPGGAKLHATARVLLVDASLTAKFKHAAEGWAWQVGGHVTHQGVAMLSVGGAEIDLGQIQVTADAAGSPGSPPALNADIAVHNAGTRHAASGIAVADVDLRIPILINSSPASKPSAGTFTIGSVTINGHKREPLKGTLAVRDDKAEFAANWAALPGSMLSVDGWLSRGSGEIAAHLPAFQLDDATAIASLVPSLTGWTITGKLGAEANVSIKDAETIGRVTIAADKVTAASKPRDLEMHDVSGAVTIDVKNGVLSTPPRQHITVARAASGKSQVIDSSLDFTLEKPDALLIEKLSAGWLSGRVSTANMRINPANPTFDTTLVADRLSLKELLALVAQGRAQGDGLISGPVHVRFDGKNFALLGGQLHSATPTGQLQVLDTKWLGETMDASDPRFIGDRELAETKRRILAALSDFKYDQLTFDFAEEPKAGGRLSVTTHGKGRVGDRPQELDFTLNFRGVNDVLNNVLKVGGEVQKLLNPEIGR